MNENNKPITLAEVVETQLADLPMPVDIPSSESVIIRNYRSDHLAKINILKREVKALPAITDKASWKMNHDMHMRLVGIRTGLNKARQAMTKPFADLKKSVDEYIGTTADSGLQAMIKELETPIEAAKAEWNEAQETIRQEALLAIQRRNSARHKHLAEQGMEFDGAAYRLGDLVVYQSDLYALEDGPWDKWCTETLAPKATAAAKAKEEKRLAQEDQERRQRELFQQQQRDQRKLDEDRAELDRYRGDLKWQKCELRALELELLGAVAETGDTHGYAMEIADQVYRVIDLADLSDEKWAEVKSRVIEANVKAIQQQENERTKSEAEILAANAAMDVELNTDDLLATVFAPKTVEHITFICDLHTKEYLGDSVYVDWDGYNVVLTTERYGFEANPSNTIILDWARVEAFIQYINRNCHSERSRISERP